jgi:carbonic anhydrase
MTLNNLNPISPQIKEGTSIQIESALQKLIEGNKRYKNGEAIHPNQSAECRAESANAPHPFAVILSCSDSRVPTEIIFDCGIGDLFVVRNAGNVINDEVLGSIEYAVEYFGVRLIVVLGHNRCGAVSAAVQTGNFPGHINSLIDALQPALEKAKKQSGDLIENTVNENVAMAVQKLKSSGAVIEPFIHHGTLKIIGATYNMDDGSISFHI